MINLPTCCVTGRIAGDPNACGDCDPCIDGAQHIPEVIKKLIKERDDWGDKYAGAMMELDDAKADAIRHHKLATDRWEALLEMKVRDDRNGSLPKAYREIIDAALGQSPRSTEKP